MPISSGLLLAASTLIPGAQAEQPGQQQQPNIILFLVDDMGWQETSVPFWKEPSPLNARYRTPNMERMAANGVKFTRAYACAVSSPSRCSLMTGMNAARHRVTNWTIGYNESTDMKGGELEMPRWNVNGIQNVATATPHDTVRSTLATPLPELLRHAGYTTIHVGKAHFGALSTQSADPTALGFDVNIAGAANGGPASYLAEIEYGAGRFHVGGLEKYYGTNTFLTEALTLEALDAIAKPIDEGKPFFLYMSHYAIHKPYDADDRFTDNYKGAVDPMLGEPLSTPEINHASLVEGMDKSLGDILDYLENRPEVAANTVVIFMSDNGGHSITPRQGRLDRDQNYPARAGKGSALEGGIREPMIVTWPGKVEPGSVNDNMVMIEDFFPAILDIGGAKDYSTVQTVDGISFKDLILDPTIRRERPTVWHFPNRWDGTVDEAEGYGAFSSLMKGPYKLIYYWQSGNRELYNVDSDIAESRNLIKEMPELADAMARELTERLKAMDAQRPTLKSTGELVAWPDER